ncbi:hypothetical protein COUCH_33445 [Couchioplanes caeruleus]|uniref:hypothetical protein n=1 Tax=Couchioplanes caeruleus TaxID=56438 RepID=UPI0020BE0759|nr:hypothetical protein [Couchioplanes caeruleus]UQU63841.1 hypothetical protein COUCH_33445 [Couchioplanes caeruleus]
MKRVLPAVVLLVLLAGGCGTDKPDASPAPAPASPASESASESPSPSESPSTTKAAPQPRFADLTQGSTTSVVKLHAYDAKSASAVVEPIIFMTGDAYCRTFKIKRSDSRCVSQEYVTEASHTKVTVPIAATAKYFTWEGADGNVCIDAPEKGGTCPMTAKEFAGWFKLNEDGMVAIATTDGTLTRMAIVYTP